MNSVLTSSLSVPSIHLKSDRLSFSTSAIPCKNVHRSYTIPCKNVHRSYTIPCKNVHITSFTPSAILCGGAEKKHLLSSSSLRLKRQIKAVEGDHNYPVKYKNQDYSLVLKLASEVSRALFGANPKNVVVSLVFDLLIQLLKGYLNKRKMDSFGSGRRRFSVLLVDDVKHCEELVERVIRHVFPSYTTVEAIKLYHVSQKYGVAVVDIAGETTAFMKMSQMHCGGLRSAIEPDQL